MGNVNTKKNYNNQERYVSQYSLSDLFSANCVNSVRSPHRDHRSWSRVSQRSWNECTSRNIFDSSKTLWPVPCTQAIFLPEFEIREGSLNDSYTILDIIATGAYGRVYKVSKPGTSEIFALKAINKARVVAENAVEQAKQEVAIQRVVGHYPFLLNSSQRWQSRRTLYILTDYICGGELFSLVERLGSLPEHVVRIYVAELALAIDFLHNAGVVHRDLKATNVLLDKDGHAVLIDFGLAKWLKREERTMTICGTPEYMAPEILKKEEYGQEVDWWSLGVLAYFLLTNQYPTVDLRNLDSPSTARMSAEISAASKDLLIRLLQPKPSLRLHSLIALQRIAFYMNHNLHDYLQKKESPFRLLGLKNLQEYQQKKMQEEFQDFDHEC